MLLRCALPLLLYPYVAIKSGALPLAVRGFNPEENVYDFSVLNVFMLLHGGYCWPACLPVCLPVCLCLV